MPDSRLRTPQASAEVVTPRISRRVLLGGLGAMIVGTGSLLMWRRELWDLIAQSPQGNGPLAGAYRRARRQGKPVLVWFGDGTRRMKLSDLLGFEKWVELAPLALCECLHAPIKPVMQDLGLKNDLLLEEHLRKFRGLLIETTGLRPTWVPQLPEPPSSGGRFDFDAFMKHTICGNVYDREEPAQKKQRILASRLQDALRQASQAALIIAPSQEALSQRAKESRAALPRDLRTQLDHALATKATPPAPLCHDAAAAVILATTTTSDEDYRGQLYKAVTNSLAAALDEVTRQEPAKTGTSAPWTDTDT